MHPEKVRSVVEDRGQPASIWDLTPAATLGVSYGGQFGSGLSDQSVRATFNWKF
ncbi:hypothetical protein [Mesorhizobium australafricanum]|uniref:Uncharacterized protein n=1 Tax=Mesorhizobium australafricanum TaxID=3072311 RepID=A0ABU4WTH6_9HYPH|nr:hypothetical protein [Mesorhizobium sp. VK3E]MDX8438232.1 hypothetical protein [Mesorhizobium sp. VK3E]